MTHLELKLLRLKLIHKSADSTEFDTLVTNDKLLKGNILYFMNTCNKEDMENEAKKKTVLANVK